MHKMILAAIAAISLTSGANAQVKPVPFTCVAVYEIKHRMYWLKCGGKLEPMGRLNPADLRKINDGDRFSCTGMDPTMGPTGCVKLTTK